MITDYKSGLWFVVTDYKSGLGALSWVLGEPGLVAIHSVFVFPCLCTLSFFTFFLVFCWLGCSLVMGK